MIKVRKGQAPDKLPRDAFRARYLERFVDPGFDGERSAIDRLEEIAWERHDDPQTQGRVLVICASDRNDGTCPGEMSKSFRLSTIAADVLKDEEKLDVDLLHLSLLTSEPNLHIHPCKGCLATSARSVWTSPAPARRSRRFSSPTWSPARRVVPLLALDPTVTGSRTSGLGSIALVAWQD